jgi:hypothetical protein
MGDYTISLGQMKSALCCIYEKLTSYASRLDAIEAALDGEGTGPSQITGPDVSTYDDARGIIGDWSWNPAVDGGTFFVKVSTSPHQWVSDPRALS